MSNCEEHQPTQPTHYDYQAIRDQLTHENQLINHRLSWLLVSQTILFAGYGVLLDIETNQSARDIDSLIDYAPTVGIVMALGALLSICGAIWNMCDLGRLDATTHKNNDSKYPRVIARPGPRVLGLIAPILMPIVFVGAWAAVLVCL